MKRLALIISSVLLLCAAIALSACGEEHVHSFGEWVIMKDPTCVFSGEKERICSCGEKQTQTVAALGHTGGEAVRENDKAASCTEDGGFDTVTYCAVCGAELSRSTTAILAEGHSFGEWTVKTKPTCAETGIRTRACSVCGGTENEIIFVSGHTLINGRCIVCGKEASKGLAYTSNGNGSCYVSGIGTCTDTDILIPAKSPSGDAVIGIENNAFKECSSLTSITIPGGMTRITGSAFSGCINLESIIIDKNYTVDYNPESCIIDPNKKEYYSSGNCIIDKTSRTLVAGCKNSVIPDDGRVESIGVDAFFGRASLTGIVIPDSVTSIGSYAFCGCTGLTNVMIPNSVTSIGSDAFNGCTGLTGVSISESVTSIDVSAFCGCTSLESVIIPNSVTIIGACSFSGCTSLISVDIPGSVTIIGSYAFNRCTSLTSVVVPDSVTGIGDFAFSDCTGLTSAVIGGGLAGIDKSLFFGCTNLIRIDIPDSVQRIGTSAFYNCTSLKTVYYNGTEAQWKAINIGGSNAPLTSAAVVYNSK